jgi:hypothetical protein
MRRTTFFFIIISSVSALLSCQTRSGFDRFFVDKTMRIDYFHSGDAKEEQVTLDQVYEQGIWAGSRENLIDRFNNGRTYAKVFDVSSGKLIFSKGFDSYFGEYKTTNQALRGTKRTFHETILIPCPKKRIAFALEVRDRENILQPLFSREVDPAAVTIIKEQPGKGVKVIDILTSGDPHHKADIVFIAEGYTSDDEQKLRSDLDRFTRTFFSQEPYKSNKDGFNIYCAFKPSEESGCDEPSHGVYKKTAISASFDSLGSERYLLTEDNKALRDVAAHVPYDALVVIVNHKRYGGGGIYNLYCTFTSDNQWQEYLFLHEFGHSFAGLGDEYYTSSVAYNEFYPRGVEPTEPNITALLDPKNLKWKGLATPGIEIPTPWEKEDFDRMDEAYQKVRQEVNERIARMKREGASAEEVEKVEQESERLSRDNAKKVDDYLSRSMFKDKIGAYEGAGYSAQGLYRPMVDCIMFTRGKKPYCRVCEQAVVRVINHYCR